jgi:serine/threonine-protein kinase
LQFRAGVSGTSELPSTPVDADLEEGRMVGEYRVEGKLGQGSFGTVFKAVQPLIGKVVAIKVLAPRFSADPEMVSRFVAEARAVNQIRHRNIIDIFSFGTLDDGRQYYVMEYLEGEPLDARIDREGRISLADALPILRGIGRALDAAHAKGVAHRDLKAENVFLGRDPDGVVFPKLLDFGIAKLLAPEDDHKHKTRTGFAVGTPYYMSPEQCKGKFVDHRTDLYAFGVLVYRMLTGEYPLDADDYMSIMIRQLADHPAPASTIVEDLPPGVDDAIAHLMQKDPADRPACLRVAVRALEVAAEQAGIVVGAGTGDPNAWDIESRPDARKYATQPPATGKPLSSKLRGVAAVPTTGATQPRRRAKLVAAIAGGLVVGGILAVTAWWLRGGDDPVVDVPQTRARVAEPPTDASARGTELPRVESAGSASGSAASPLAGSVFVNVTGVPEGTEVLVEGRTVGAAPGPVQLPRGDAPVVLTFKLDGYLPLSKTVTPARDQDLVLALKKKPTSAGAPAKRSSKDDIIDVFGKGQ